MSLMHLNQNALCRRWRLSLCTLGPYTLEHWRCGMGQGRGSFKIGSNAWTTWSVLYQRPERLTDVEGDLEGHLPIGTRME